MNIAWILHDHQILYYRFYHTFLTINFSSTWTMDPTAKVKLVLKKNLSFHLSIFTVISAIGLVSGINSTKLVIQTASCTYEINHQCTDNIKFILFNGWVHIKLNNFIWEILLNYFSIWNNTAGIWLGVYKKG